VQPPTFPPNARTHTHTHTHTHTREKQSQRTLSTNSLCPVPRECMARSTSERHTLPHSAHTSRGTCSESPRFARAHTRVHVKGGNGGARSGEPDAGHPSEGVFDVGRNASHSRWHEGVACQAPPCGWAWRPLPTRAAASDKLGIGLSDGYRPCRPGSPSGCSPQTGCAWVQPGRGGAATRGR
jgi:hypothetical protein